MASVYLSPGVFPREIDLSVIPTATGAILPAFIGVANKGPMNEPTLVTNGQQYIDIFGEPFSESYLGYAVLAYMEEGQRAYILRVGIECEDTLPDDLLDVCIDISGAREGGWGRIPVFSGIDFGKICTRVIDADNPVEFHDAAVFNISYNDIDTGTCESDAILEFSGATGLSDAYTGSIDDTFTVLITSDPTSGTLDGAGYQVIRGSDGDIVAEGTLTESGAGTSDPVDIGDGLAFRVVITNSCPIGENDTFTFEVRPDNKTFSFNVDRQETVTEFSFSDGDSYDDPGDFADALNALVAGATYVDYVAVEQTDGTVCIRSDDAGKSIQLMSTEAFALEIGQVLYAYDIPRSFLISRESGPYTITNSNNHVYIDVVGETSTANIDFTLPIGTFTESALAAQIDIGGIQLGERYFKSYALTVPGDYEVVIIETSIDHQFEQLKMLANTSHTETLRFAEELDIIYPYTRAYRGFSDPRVVLPDPGVSDPSVPLSCETAPLSDECAADSAYYQAIVGFIVAKYAGTWVEDLRVTVEKFVDAGDGADAAGRYNILISDTNNIELDRIEDVNFDPTAERYVANVVNEGSSIGGVNGNEYIQWIDRPSYLQNDPEGDPDNFEVRDPAPFNNGSFTGAADGYSTDSTYSSQLDAAVIGNPAENTGIFAFQNPEIYDISLLVIPGFSSGAVIGQGLQLCQSRGDCLYIVDPPQGLTAQQVVDWHNGMLLSDLAAAINSSYGALYHPWLKIFDQFSAENIYIPPSGYAASVFARTENVAEIWFAPAGLNRGHLLTALDVEYDLTQGERDLLYGLGNAVNPIVNFPQDGITIWGQRTLQRRQSALDRINVRMLLIFLKKNLGRLLRNFVFEQNDRITRAQIVSVINPFLGDVAARRGLTAYHTICDERNNTPERIDRNELWISCLLKPTRVAEFIVLNLAILRTDASFSSQEILQAAGVVVTG